jgi:hypothetical protein
MANWPTGRCANLPIKGAVTSLENVGNIGLKGRQIISLPGAPTCMGPVLHIFFRKFVNPFEVQEAINGLKVGKTPGPNGILNRALMHLPKRATTFLTNCLTLFFTGSTSTSMYTRSRRSHSEAGKGPHAVFFL